MDSADKCESAKDGSFFIPTWSYFKVGKWVLSVLSTSGIVAALAKLVPGREIAEYALALMLTLLSFLFSGWLAYLGAGKQDWWNRWDDGVHPFKSTRRIVTYLFGATLVVAGGVSFSSAIVSLIINTAKTYLLSFIESNLVVAIMLLFVISLLIGLIAVRLSLKLRSIKYAKRLQKIAQEAFQERDAKEFPSFLCLAVGAVCMLYLPISISGLGIIGFARLGGAMMDTDACLYGFLFVIAVLIGALISWFSGCIIAGRTSLFKKRFASISVLQRKSGASDENTKSRK